MKIIELKGKSHTFNLKNGNTLRILSHQTKKVADNSISDELKIAEDMGLIKMIQDSTEVPKNKKLGGTK